MKIALISQFWPGIEKNGVAMAANTHAHALIAAGYHVEIIGPCGEILLDDFKKSSQHYINAKGSGSIYSPIRINKNHLHAIFEWIDPELVIVEGWQTAITETAIDIASNLRLPVLMLSHGVSVHAFEGSLKEWMRSIAWRYYRQFTLPSKVMKLTAITCLSGQSCSSRFYDRELAMKFGVPVFRMGNIPPHYKAIGPIIPRQERALNLLIIGYFSRIKNQRAALNLLRHLPDRFTLTLIGQKKGSYYEQCKKFVMEHNLLHRTFFLEDHECAISQQISQSLAVLSTSITEVLPIVLLEAMVSGTPFIATSVGAVPSLNGGLACSTMAEQIEAILSLESDIDRWNFYAKNGLKQFESTFSPEKVNAQLINAVEETMLKAGRY